MYQKGILQVPYCATLDTSALSALGECTIHVTYRLILLHTMVGYSNPGVKEDRSKIVPGLQVFILFSVQFLPPKDDHLLKATTYTTTVPAIGSPIFSLFLRHSASCISFRYWLPTMIIGGFPNSVYRDQFIKVIE